MILKTQIKVKMI